MNDKRFFLLGKIGAGGFSQVFKVMSKAKEVFALKVIRYETKAQLEMYRNEASLLLRLRAEKHVIRLVDIQENLRSRTINMVFELGEVDLAQFLDNNKNMSENAIRHIWQEMLMCIAACHQHKVIHLDLKPANFVFVKGRLKIIDFGIAKEVSRPNTTNIIRESQVGTLNYMSPESIMESNSDQPGHKLGRSSDVWSLGIVLYRVVYGFTPFSKQKTLYAKLRAITDPNYQVPFPPAPLFGSDRTVVNLLRSCLERDPKKRPTVQHLLLHPFLSPSRSLFSNPTPATVPPTSAPVDVEKVQLIIEQLQRLGLVSQLDTKDDPSLDLTQLATRVHHLLLESKPR